jgi:hypothetical protein
MIVVLAAAPHATLLTFGRYVARSGPGKATFVDGLRQARQSGSGFNPHAQFVKALKADIQFRTRGDQGSLAAVVDAVKPRWRPLYTTLRTGAEQYLESLGDPGEVGLAQTRDALGILGGLTIRINPQLGLRFGDGRAEAVRLHFDEQPPSEQFVILTLHLMARHIQQILPGATPVLVDLRRAVTHRPDPKVRPDAVERWLAGEAAAFGAIWTTAA